MERQPDSYFKVLFEESPLFQQRFIDEQYKTLSNKDLLQELEAYCNGALHNISQYQEVPSLGLRLSLDNRSADERTLKSLLLYASSIAIPDQLFPEYISLTPLNRALNDTFGIGTGNDTSRNRMRIANLASSLLEKRTAIEKGFVIPVPVDALSIQQGISFSFSPKRVPDDLRVFFKNKAEVRPVDSKCKDSWPVLDEQVSLDAPCETIHVCFGAESDLEQVFRFARTKSSVDIEARKFSTASMFATPTIEEFGAWVGQSIDGTAVRVLETLGRDLYWSEFLDASYITKSPFKFQVLERVNPSLSNVDERVANATLELDLPVLDSVDLNLLCRVREQEGEAFESFRSELSRKLRDISFDTEDPFALDEKLQNIAHELTECQVQDVQREMGRIKKSQTLSNIKIVSGVLLAALKTPLPVMLGSWLGVNGVAQVAEKYYSEKSSLRSKPGYLLWRLDNESRK